MFYLSFEMSFKADYFTNLRMKDSNEKGEKNSYV